MRRALPLLLLLLTASFATAQPGTLDPSFGEGGIAVGERLNHYAFDHALNGQGRVFVTGNAPPEMGSGIRSFTAAYTNEGTLDSSFGTEGYSYWGWPGTYLEGQRIVALPDESLLRFIIKTNSASISVNRIRPDGAIVCSASAGTGGRVGGASVTPDGDVVFASRKYGNPYAAFGIVTKVAIDYAAGSCGLATGFGTGGSVQLRVPDRQIDVTDVAVMDDGRLIVTGWIQLPSPYIRDPRAFIARLLPDGALDPTFGPNGQGYATTEGTIALDLIPLGVAVTPEGALVLAGQLGPFGEHHAFALRFSPDGALDPAFGDGGLVEIGADLSTTSLVNDLVVDADGRPVLAGYVGSAWALARLETNGALDATFGDGGIALLRPDGLPGSLVAVALQPDGRIVTAGQSHQPMKRRSGPLSSLPCRSSEATSMSFPILAASTVAATRSRTSSPLSSAPSSLGPMTSLPSKPSARPRSTG